MRLRTLLTLALSASLAAAFIAAARPSPARRTSGSRTSIPTEREALAFLTETHQRAKQAVDATTFCADGLARLTCINQYNESGGRDAVPVTSPQVVNSWTTGPTRVLTVCGVDGEGERYRADFPVRYAEDGTLLSVLDVFWNSKTYSGNKAPDEPILASRGPEPQTLSC